ncbi:UDP-glucuronosyltransferase 2B1 isoform X2 [Procambarus clarkii]|uniref:UDP-glucuronosyltransferase 2B1 isoform X2 n=1 Tax=Procambarus clarkii TaxID=6728 RepID=UPI0037428E89
MPLSQGSTVVLVMAAVLCGAGVAGLVHVTQPPGGGSHTALRHHYLQDQGAKILVLHPIYAGSHELTLRRFGEELVKRGHQVTQVRWRSSKTREVNSTVEVITLSPDNRDLRYPYMQPDGTFHPPTTMLWERPRHVWQIPTDVFGLIDAHCLTLLGDRDLARRLRAANFTLAVVDIIGNECSLALAHALRLPVVGFWGFSFQGGERLAPRSPRSQDLLREIEVILVHSHWIIDYPKLMPPHVQYIGCIQCGPPAPLPPYIDRWMSEASTGVVVFSLGFTGYEATSVPTRVMDAFLAAFSRLQQRVLLRFNPALLPYVPDNIMVVDWLPQHDVLGHPNTVLFVTHCGQNGINEAVYHGVPIVGFPIFADQGDNARRVVDHGLGLVIDKAAITEELAYTTITAVLNNSRYRQTARRFSALWQEESESGMEKGARWVEKVHRHGRLTHLRMPGEHLSLVQYFALDVAAFLLLVALALCCLLYAACCLSYMAFSLIRKKEKEKCQ